MIVHLLVIVQNDKIKNLGLL